MSILLLVLATTAVLLLAASLLREVVGDDPRRLRGYVPPRSHPADAFEAGASTYR